MRVQGSASPDARSRVPGATASCGGGATEIVVRERHFATGLEQGDQPRFEERVSVAAHALGSAKEALAALDRRSEVLPDTDDLLGIASRRYFDARLPEELRRATRERRPLALLMIDVDYLKRYNDTYGRQAGDACLQSVARAVRSAVNRAGDLLARYGGEELAVILPNTDLDGSLVLAQAIQHRLADLHISHSDSAVADEVTVSIGVAIMLGAAHSSAAGLIAAADRGLHVAKERGRNRIGAGWISDGDRRDNVLA